MQVPKQPAPVVNVIVPEQPAPVVKVKAPEPKRKRLITHRDAQGNLTGATVVEEPTN